MDFFVFLFLLKAHAAAFLFRHYKFSSFKKVKTSLLARVIFKTLGGVQKGCVLGEGKLFEETGEIRKSRLVLLPAVSLN